MDFKTPNVLCKYKVALFVNPGIDNSEECRKYQFHKNNYAQIHTLEKTICPKLEHEIQEKEQHATQTETSSCKVIEIK